MAKAVTPRCPSCGAAIQNPKLVKISAETYGSGWMSEAAPLAIGFQCAAEGCGVLLPLTAYPPSIQARATLKAG